MLDFQATRWLTGHEVPPQAGNNHPTSIPTGVFKTSDGYINIAAAGQKMWEKVCETLGFPSSSSIPTTQLARRARKIATPSTPLMEKVTVNNTSAYWVAAFNKTGVPCGPIYSIDQTFADEQVKHLRIAKDVQTQKPEEDHAGRPAGGAVAHAERYRGATADAWRAHRRDSGRIRLQQGRDRKIARREDSLSYTRANRRHLT